jgi:Domain of unknown function (DUF4286)
LIIYNVTTKVNYSIADEWLQWIKEEHIPDLTATGCFTHAVVLQLLEADDSDVLTYAVQYYADNKVMYDRYIHRYADDMRKKAINKWGNNFISFRTLLQVVD